MCIRDRVEGDEVEVEAEFGGSVVECASEDDVVCEDVQTPSVCDAEDSDERKKFHVDQMSN